LVISSRRKFKRFNISAKRLAIPELPKEVFIEGLKRLLRVDDQWIPTEKGSSSVH